MRTALTILHPACMTSIDATRAFTAIIRGVAGGEIHAGVWPDVARDMFLGALEHLGMGGARRGDGALAFFALFWRAIRWRKPTRDNG